MKRKILSVSVTVAIISVGFLAYNPTPRVQVMKASVRKPSLIELGEFTDPKSGTLLELLENDINYQLTEVQNYDCQCDAVSVSGTYTAGYWDHEVYHDPTCTITYAGMPYGWSTYYSGILQFY